MSKTPKIIHVLRVLIVLLLVVMILFGAAIFYIQNESKKNIVEAAQVLQQKNKPLEILDLCIQQIYNVDNDFRLYTLSFSKESFDKYRNRLKAMDSLTSALRASLSSGTGNTNSIYSLQSGNREKEAMQASLGKLRRMADSLLYTANSLQLLNEDGVKPDIAAIKQYDPDLTFIPASISSDTVKVVTEETTKKKKGFFAKVKTFFKGDTQTTKTQKNISVKSGSQTGSTKSNRPVTLTEVGIEVARQTNQYYEKQLKDQYQLNQQLKEKEKALIVLNSRLMSNISGIFRELKRDNMVREERVQNLHASSNIACWGV